MWVSSDRIRSPLAGVVYPLPSVVASLRSSGLLLTYEAREEEAIILYSHYLGSIPAASPRNIVHVCSTSLYECYLPGFVYSNGTLLTYVKLLQGFAMYERSHIDGALLCFRRRHD